MLSPVTTITALAAFDPFAAPLGGDIETSPSLRRGLGVNGFGIVERPRSESDIADDVEG